MSPARDAALAAVEDAITGLSADDQVLVLCAAIGDVAVLTSPSPQQVIAGAVGRLEIFRLDLQRRKSRRPSVEDEKGFKR